MKLLSIDYILILINITLIILLYKIIRYLHDNNKIYNRNSILTRICNRQWKENTKQKELKVFLDDKLKVKKFNSKYLPEMMQAKTLFILEDIEQIRDINYHLPDKYVVKYGQGTGLNLIVDTKIPLNDIIDKCNSWPKKFIKFKRNRIQYWHNVTVNPVFFIEEYIGDNLVDYKFHTYKGNVMLLEVIGNRYGDTKGVEKGSKNKQSPTYTLYDNQGNMNNHLTINSYDDRGKFIPSRDPYPLPINFEKMKELCQRFYEITKIPFCRIDFYEINGNVYFGEYTFIPNHCNILLNTKYEQFLIDKYNI